MSALVLLIVGVSASLASAQSLPSPWTASDIGSPAIAGAQTYSGGTFSVVAGGKDIWDTSDQFRFVYQPVAGDMVLTARVDAIVRADPWTKVGVMIRSSLTANAAHGMALVSSDYGPAFLRRLSAGAVSSLAQGAAAPLPRWLRVARVGNKITASTSSNGTTWTTLGSDTVALGTTAYVGLAVTSHNVKLQTTADYSQVTVTTVGASPLPSPQQAADIGVVAIAGTTSYSQGTYTIKAAGKDIWDVADQFHFVYQPVSGDLDIKARVASITAADPWSKAGVMVRETLAAGSRQALAMTSAAKGYAFQRRIDPDGFSENTGGGTGAAPGWVRLVRTGNTFEAFRSANGTTWTSMGTDVVPMGTNVYVGLAVTSHNVAATTTAVLDSFAVSGATTPSNSAPTVSITSPVAGLSLTAPADVAITATAADTDGTIARVVFYNGSTQIASDTAAPYTAALTGLAAGTYSLTAVAFDNDGASTTSAAVPVVVTSTANKPPTVSLTAPATGASYTAPATIAFAASASDPEGKLARVEFYSGATLVRSDTSAPYSYSWTNVANGTYTLKAVAYDTAGLSGTSATVTVTVGATANKPPTVSLTAPANGANYAAPATIALAATASDPEGKLARVEFYSGTTLVATDTSAPYSYSIASVPAGSYSFRAVAYDTAGLSGSSATVTVTVSTATSTAPTKLMFGASSNHDSAVTSYRFDVFASGANPATATPVATTDLGKPTPATNGDITVDRTAFFAALAAGNYIATVTAVGPGGSARGVQATFAR